MSRPAHTSPGTRRKELVAAYHDGELSGLARWRFERKLRRSPELRRELAALSELGDLIRESHAGEGGPDLWDAIAQRLPAQGARRSEAVGGRSRGLQWLAVPGAVAATAALAVAFASGWLEPERPASEGVVRWLESRGRDVMVLEEGPDTTIIWVFDGPTQGGARGDAREAV